MRVWECVLSKPRRRWGRNLEFNFSKYLSSSSLSSSSLQNHKEINQKKERKNEEEEANWTKPKDSDRNTQYSIGYGRDGCVCGDVGYEPARCNVYAFLPACLLLLATRQRCGILQLPLAEILGKEAHREGVNAPEHIVSNHTTRCLGQQLAKLGEERGHS